MDQRFKIGYIFFVRLHISLGISCCFGFRGNEKFKTVVLLSADG